MAKVDKKRLGTWERKILRRTYRPMGKQGIWRISNNQELRELCTDLDIVVGLKKKREREWNGLDI